MYLGTCTTCIIFLKKNIWGTIFRLTVQGNLRKKTCIIRHNAEAVYLGLRNLERTNTFHDNRGFSPRCSQPHTQSNPLPTYGRFLSNLLHQRVFLQSAPLIKFVKPRTPRCRKTVCTYAFFSVQKMWCLLFHFISELLRQSSRHARCGWYSIFETRPFKSVASRQAQLRSDRQANNTGLESTNQISYVWVVNANISQMPEVVGFFFSSIYVENCVDTGQALLEILNVYQVQSYKKCLGDAEMGALLQQKTKLVGALSDGFCTDYCLQSNRVILTSFDSDRILPLGYYRRSWR